jgi:glutathione synthase/RimK-type ligase-like ATP-grasp enzyme
MTPRLVIVGVPGEKRTAALLRAAERRGIAARCVPWSVALAAPALVGAAGSAGDFLRVESPGADAATWHALSRLGGDERPVDAFEWRPGRSWFGGLTRFLRALDEHSAHLRTTHPSAQILAMTDKRVCHERLARAGVPVPEALPAAHDADELREIMRGAGRSAVYIKPRWGSSGAGVLAFRRGASRELLTTTAQLEGGRLYNRKRLCTYHTRGEIDLLIGAVLADGAIVQRWLPKLGTARGPFDLRVLVVRGRIAQTVARIGRGTITNLHLDALRAGVDEVLAPLGPAAASRVYETCQRAAACFPGHHCVGVDVMVDPRGNPFVLECNAWGDYLPRLLVDGMDSYELYLQGLFDAAGAAGHAG